MHEGFHNLTLVACIDRYNYELSLLSWTISWQENIELTYMLNIYCFEASDVLGGHYAELWINNKLSRIASETICHISYNIKFTITTNHINVLTPTFTSCGECSQPTPTKILWLCQPYMRYLQAINILLSTLWST